MSLEPHTFASDWSDSSSAATDMLAVDVVNNLMSFSDWLDAEVTLSEVRF